MEAKKHKQEELLTSDEIRNIAYHGYGIYDNFAHGVWDAREGFNPDGSYTKYMNNADAAQLFEDLYQIKEDIKALVESQVFQDQQELDWATLEDPHFKKMFKWAQDDLDIHSWEELEDRLMTIGRKIRKGLKNCPVAQRLKKQVIRLLKFIDKTKKVSDLPSKKEFEDWWNAHDFKPWM